MSNKLIHRLSDIDAVNKRAICAVCGPVDIAPKLRSWICKAKKRADDRRRKTHPKTPLHKHKYRAGIFRYKSGVTNTIDEIVALRLKEKCAICGGPGQCVDHNHITGRIRDRLCHGCNHGLGHFKESPELMYRAIEYLKQHT